jgi:signal transduction histidine kinase
MPERLSALVQDRVQDPRIAAVNWIRPWSPGPLLRGFLRGLALAAAVGLAYFFAAQLSLGLLIKPDGVAVFWPAAGISSGVLIALGPKARWPVALGAIAATLVANLMGDRTVWAAAAFAICNAAEALITAGLVQHYSGAAFSLDRLRDVLMLFGAAIIGTIASGIGGAISYKLFHSPDVSMFTTWWHWFGSDAVGIIAVAPLVIGLASAARQLPPRRQFVEGIAALALLGAMTGIIISLPEQPWETVVPGALLFPMLLWLAARCRPVFAAAGGFMVSIAIVWTTIVGIGHFGDTRLPLNDRILQAQAVILVVTLGACVLAALFSERRESEARLARSNLMLERERHNKLMNAQAITASIAHEVRQPLAAIATNGGAALRFLAMSPPNYAEVQAATERIIRDSHRTSEVFDGIRALFRDVDQRRVPVDLNEVVLDVLQSLAGELKSHGVVVRRELAAELLPVDGHRGQLLQVIFNLVNNAIEAMNTTADRNRVLNVRTQLRQPAAVVVDIQDSGPGIDPKQLDEIFGAFFTTKAQGMGLGLAICRMIIEHHGGRLTASSDGRTGALFQFVLPTEAAEETGLASEAAL